MKRPVPVLALLALSLTLACGRSAPEPAATAPAPPPHASVAEQAPPTPPPCEAVKDPKTTVEIRVSANAGVDKECVEIWKGNETTVVWVAADSKDRVDITWKAQCPDGTKPTYLPARPTPSGDRCTLAPKDYAGVEKTTELCYRVVYTSPGKPPVVKDPKLIVNP